ncbi:MAG: GNAT family N-acetyltransferase [Bacteroidales bacterium]|nr:GNAT family N-acetyltransferase [Bacteroidales bacterium]
MTIREFDTNEAYEVYLLIEDIYNNVDLGGHTAKGVKIQIKGHNPHALIRTSKSINYLVAEIENKVVGIIGYDITKLYSLFVSREHHRKGIGSRLLEEAVHQIKKQGSKQVYTFATKLSVPFYQKHGFEMVDSFYFPEGRKEIELVELKMSL